MSYNFNDSIEIDDGSVIFTSGGTSTILESSQTGNRTVTIPDITDTLVTKTSTDTLTNKTLVSPVVQNDIVFDKAANDLTLSVSNQTSGVATATIPDLGGVSQEFLFTTQTQTLTNKIFTGLEINDTSADHQYIFGVSELAADRTVTLPLLTGNDTFVFEAHTQTLTNKTLTSPVIAQISNTGTLTLPTSTDTLVGRATTDTLTNKTISSSTNTVGANEIRTTGASVVVDTAAPPTEGQTLTATSATSATWQYSDNRNSVRVATTAAGTLATSFENGDTVDGVVLATGNRILIKDQSTGTENGIYVVQASGAPVRAGDFPSGAAVASSFVFVQEGTSNGDNGFLCTNDTGGDVVGTDALVFTRFTFGEANTAANVGVGGVGVYDSKSGVELRFKNIAPGSAKITVTDDSGNSEIDIDVSEANLSLNNIGGGPLNVSSGGTGASSLTSGNVLMGNGTGAVSVTKAAPTGDFVGTTDTQTLTNKTLTSPVLTTPQVNDTSADHQYIFAVNELTADRTVTLPLLTGNDTFVFETHTQTLSNKTLTLPQINDTSSDHQYVFAVSELLADRTVTLPLLTGNDTFVFESHTQTLSNKTLSSPTVSGNVVFDEATNDLTLAVTDQATGTATVTIPDLGGVSQDFVFTSQTQTLTNKTLTSPVLTTPQINDTSADHQYIFGVSELLADRTVTLPLLGSNDTFVFESHTQTLSNKTLTLPQINDTSSNHQYIFAVNELVANRTVTLPLLTGNDTFVFEAHTQTLTNKSLVDDSTSIVDSGDSSISINFDAGGTTSTSTTLTSTQTANRVLTLPDITDTVVTRTNTETLTNKTIVASSNNVAANSLKTTGAAVDVASASPPSVGRVLTATSATSATWQVPSGGGSGDFKASVRVATTAAGTLATSFENGDTIDGVVLVTGDRILIKNQATATENGVYTVEASGAPTRATDFASASAQACAVVFVEEGTVNADTGWLCTNDIGSDVVGTDNLAFAQFDVVGTLSVARGGTGATTHASGNVLIGAGTSAITSTKAAPTGDFVGTSDTQTLTNKTLTAPVLTTPEINDTSADHQYIFAVSELLADRTVTLPLLTGNDTFVFEAHTQTLSNKTLTSPVLTTPQVNDTSADHQYIFAVSELAADRTVTLPLLTGNDTFVFEAHTQTLTNKTLDSATNTITADNLHSASTTIDVSSASAPSTGQVLTATSSTAATWQFPSAGGSDDFKNSVAVATTTAGTLATSFENGDTVDGVVLVTGDRILIKNQSTATENGIYTVQASGAPTRTADFAASSAQAGAVIFVEKGTANGDTGWVCTNDTGSDVVGTDNLTFAQFDVVGTLSVARGGTGATTHGSGNVLIGAGTSAITSTKAAPTGDFVGTSDTQTLSNKTLTAPVLTTPEINDTSADHQYIFAVNELTADRTVTLPLLTGNDTFVFEAHTQTLSNKTLSSPTVSGNVVFDEATNDLTLAVSDQATGIATATVPDLGGVSQDFVFTSQTQTLTNKTLTSPVLTTPQVNDTSADHQYIFAVSELLADRTVTLPLLTGNDTFVFESHTQTLSNKTLTSPTVSGNVVFDEATNDLTLAVTDQASGTATATVPDLGGVSQDFVFTSQTQTLSNKTLTSPVLTTPQINDTSADHQYIFAVSELLADRTVTLPLLTGNDTFVFEAHAQTLSNKTLASPVINTPTVSGNVVFDEATNDLTLAITDQATGTATATVPDLGGVSQDFVFTSQTQTLANKTLTSPVLTTPQINDTSADHQYIFAVNELIADRTVTLPLLGSNDTFVFEAHTQTLSNKTLASPVINTPTISGNVVFDEATNDLTLAVADQASGTATATIPDLGGTSQDFVFTTQTQTLINKILTLPEINDTSSDHQYVFGVNELTADRTVTLPLLTGNDTFVFEAHTQTLSNKTLTSPVINTPTISGNVVFDEATNDLTLAITDQASGTATATIPDLGGVSQDFVFTSQTQTLSNKTLTSPVLTTPQVNDTSADHQYIFAVSELLADRTVTLPLLTGNDTFVFESHTQTLSNKTLSAPTVSGNVVFDEATNDLTLAVTDQASGIATATVPDLGGVSQDFVFTSQTQTLSNKTLTSPVLTTPQINDTSADHQYIFGVSELLADRTVTLPLLTGNDTFVFEAHTQTLTNKTISSSTNTVGANEIRTTGASVVVDTAGPPSTGQVLTATSATAASWQAPSTGSSDYKDSVRVATTAAGTLATSFENGDTVDGVVLATGNRILIKNQATATENGIYTVEASGAPTRTVDFAAASGQAGAILFVEEGTVNGDTAWVCTNNNGSDVVGTDNLVFAQFDVVGTLSVARGGTGATTHGSGNVLVGAGTSAITSTKAAPTGDFVGTSDTQTLTNKTLTAPVLTTPEINDTSADHQYIFGVSELAADRTVTLPLLGSNDTFVFEAHTQTLTNKTLDSTTNTITADNLHSATTTIDVSSATAPSSGQVLTATSGTAATWQTPSVFGSEYQVATNNDTSSTSSTTFVQVLRLTTSSVPAGDYRIGFQYTWNYDNQVRDFKARVQIDDTTTIHNVVCEPPEGSPNQLYPVCGFSHNTLGSGTHTVDIDIATSNSADTASIRDMRIEFWRVA